MRTSQISPDSVFLVLTGSPFAVSGLIWSKFLMLLNQGCDGDMLRATGVSLSGAPAPSLGPLDPPPAEDVKAIEAQRQRLQKRWRLLLNTGQFISLATHSHTVQSGRL